MRSSRPFPDELDQLIECIHRLGHTVVDSNGILKEWLGEQGSSGYVYSEMGHGWSQEDEILHRCMHELQERGYTVTHTTSS